MKESDCVIPYLPFGNHLALRGNRIIIVCIVILCKTCFIVGTEDTHHKLAALMKDHSYTKAKLFQCDESCYKCTQQYIWEKPVSHKPAQSNALKKSSKSKIRSSKPTHASSLFENNKKTFRYIIHSNKCKNKYDLPVQNIPLRVSALNYTRENSTECKICNCKFSNVSTLRVHSLRFHRIQKTFQCAICSYKCEQEDYLNKHLLIHSGDKPFECHICDYKCTDVNHLKMHLKAHSSKQFIKYKLCKEKFSQKSTFLEHNIHFHSDEVKPFLL